MISGISGTQPYTFFGIPKHAVDHQNPCFPLVLRTIEPTDHRIRHLQLVIHIRNILASQKAEVQFRIVWIVLTAFARAFPGLVVESTVCALSALAFA